MGFVGWVERNKRAFTPVCAAMRDTHHLARGETVDGIRRMG
jgi:hypothetical protein